MNTRIFTLIAVSLFLERLFTTDSAACGCQDGAGETQIH